MDQHDILNLRERIGDEHLGRRLRAQTDLSVQLLGSGRGRFHFENTPQFIKLLQLFLWLTRLRSKGERNALKTVTHENVVEIRGIPAPFEGMGILHLSDLHIDGCVGFGRHLAGIVKGLDFDLCVLTGDFRFYDVGQYDKIVAELTDLLPELQCRFGIFGILGNHDFIEMVPILERMGIRMLLNESVALRQDSQELWLTGLDDVHLYGLHDMDKAMGDIPPDSEAPRIALIHSPELIPEAAAAGFDLYLTGHTHAGQICLPNGWAPLINARCPRRHTAGAWQFGTRETGAAGQGMAGYTSAGTGSSGVFVRFFCPPEIVVHRLQRATSD